MDAEQGPEGSDMQTVRLSSKQFSYLRKQKKAKSPSTSLFIVIIVILLLLLLATSFFLISLRRRIGELQAQRAQDVGRLWGKLVELTKANSKYEAEFERMDTEIKWLNSQVGQQSSSLKSPIRQAYRLQKFTSINQTTLLPYIQSRFNSHKVTINFLHAHQMESYFFQKVDFLKSCLQSKFLKENQRARSAYMLALNNINLPHFNITIEKQRRANERKDYERLSKEYDFNLPELPFCIVVATINNAINFRYQYNLQSMINLDYKNFKIVIIDDASTDHTYELILQWIEDNKVTHNITVIRNEKRLTAVPNIYTAVTKYCSADDIVVLVDGDDEILGRYAFKVFNHIYQKNKVDIVYSCHLILYTNLRQIRRGWSKAYSDEEIKNNRYRNVIQKIAHLRSFKAKLYLKVRVQDMKDWNGEWYTSTYDEVICLPMLEMACGRTYYVEEFFYLYNYGLGSNDVDVDFGLQKRIADEVKYRRNKYECLPQLK